jgi:UDP-N-acetyl-D-glucosamine dehydrogenase
VFEDLFEKIDSRQATVAILGLGYVGLPVAVAFAEAGFPVIGLDVNESKVDMLKTGRSYLRDVSNEMLEDVIRSGRFRATTYFPDLEDADAILICVPTPLADGAPDLSLVVSAGTSLSEVLTRGSIVVLESTTYPGTTDDVLRRSCCRS